MMRFFIKAIGFGFIILLMISLRLFAQEVPAYMYLKEEPKGEEGKGIQTGYVVAYGEKIPPPYFVTVSGDTLKINGILVRPPLKDPNERPLVTHWEKLSDEQRGLASHIESIYKGYLGEMEEKQAQERLIREFKTHPLISTLYFSRDGKFLYIDFSDGRFLPTTVKSRQLFFPPSPPGEEPDLAKERREQAEEYRCALRNGGMVLFGYIGLPMTCSGEIAKKVTDIVIRVKRGDLTAEEGEQRMDDLLHYKHRVKEIIGKVNTW
jgi:hypothetical protein